VPPDKLRILIIDDEECIRDSLALYLTEQGHETLTFEQPTKCPAFNDHACGLNGACADIILVDHNMPGISGLDYLKQLTRHGCRVLPPNRILMTGDASPELTTEVLQMGCKIVQKPLRFDQLEDIVNTAKVFISDNRSLSDIY